MGGNQRMRPVVLWIRLASDQWWIWVVLALLMYFASNYLEGVARQTGREASILARGCPECLKNPVANPHCSFVSLVRENLPRFISSGWRLPALPSDRAQLILYKHKFNSAKCQEYTSWLAYPVMAILFGVFAVIFAAVGFLTRSLLRIA
jgi:hypothetical protein